MRVWGMGRHVEVVLEGGEWTRLAGLEDSCRGTVGQGWGLV